MAGLGQASHRGGCVRRVRRIAEFVGCDAKRAVFLRTREDLGDEVVAARAEQPRHAHDVELPQQIAHDMLAGCLASRVRAHWVRRVPLAVQLALQAVEHLVGADVHHGRSGPLSGQRQVLRSESVDPVCQFRVFFRAVHIGERRTMDDQLGRKSCDALYHGRICDIVVRQVERKHIMRPKRGEKLAAELTVVPGDHSTHGCAILHWSLAPQQGAQFSANRGQLRVIRRRCVWLCQDHEAHVAQSPGMQHAGFILFDAP